MLNITMSLTLGFSIGIPHNN